MRPRTPQATGLVLAAALLVSAAAPGHGAPPVLVGGTPGATVTPEAHRTADGARAVAARHAAPAAPAVRWGACPPGTTPPERCGTVTVPLDHDRPDGPAIEVGVSRAPATGTPAERQGVLVFNFGGPGAAAVGLAGAFAQALPEPVRRAYDIVGFDVRGRGTSTRITCLDVATFARGPRPDPGDTSPAGRRAVEAFARAYADGCRAAGSALLPHLTTRQIARDLDAVRAALGEERLDYLGYSYGTYLGAVYGTLFPHRVRRMVLDSVVDPERVWYPSGADQARAFHARFGDWARWAARYDHRYHLGRTPEAVTAWWRRTRAALAARPAGGDLGGAEFDALTVTNLYSDRQWPAFTQALGDHAARGDGVALRALGGGVTEDDVNTDSVFQAVTCADAPYPADPGVLAADTEELKRAYGEIGAFIASAGPCLYLQSARRPPVGVDGSALPGILLVQAVDDPATPMPGALSLQRAVPGARMVTVVGTGNHGQYLGGGPCVDSWATRYLVEGLLPAADVTCQGVPAPDPDRPGGTDGARDARRPLPWPARPAAPSG